MTKQFRDEALRRIITREIPDTDEKSIPTFNDFPDWMLREVREVAMESRRGAEQYIRFYLAQDVYTVNIAEFVDEVVLQRQPAATWRVHDCLRVPRELTSSTLLTANYFQVLDEAPGEKWYRLVESLDVHPATSLHGAIGTLQRNVRFAPKIADEHPSTMQVVIGSSNVEEISNDRVAQGVRRWLAHRMAWVAQPYVAEAGPMVAAQGIIDSISRGQPLAVTRDAEVAAAALAREARAHGAEADFLRRAGFLGPDSWYEG